MRFSILFALAVLVPGWTWASDAIPCTHPDYARLPVLIEGCEGEGCGLYETDLVVEDTKILQAPGPNSRVIGTVTKCGRVTAIEYFYKLTHPGEAIVLSLDGNEPLKASGVRVGDSLALVRRLGEGQVLVCVETAVFSVEAFFSPPDVNVTTLIDSEAWAEVTTEEGVRGWIRNSSDALQGKYNVGICPITK